MGGPFHGLLYFTKTPWATPPCTRPPGSTAGSQLQNRRATGRGSPKAVYRRRLARRRARYNPASAPPCAYRRLLQTFEGPGERPMGHARTGAAKSIRTAPVRARRRLRVTPYFCAQEHSTNVAEPACDTAFGSTSPNISFRIAAHATAHPLRGLRALTESAKIENQTTGESLSFGTPTPKSSKPRKTKGENGEKNEQNASDSVGRNLLSDQKNKHEHSTSPLSPGSAWCRRHSATRYYWGNLAV